MSGDPKNSNNYWKWNVKNTKLKKYLHFDIASENECVKYIGDMLYMFLIIVVFGKEQRKLVYSVMKSSTYKKFCK